MAVSSTYCEICSIEPEATQNYSGCVFDVSISINVAAMNKYLVKNDRG